MAQEKHIINCSSSLRHARNIGIAAVRHLNRWILIMIDVLLKVTRLVLKAIAVILPLWFIFGLWSMGGSHTYHQQAMVYLDGAQNVLIAHGLCQNRSDCVKRHILFGSGGAFKIGPFEFGGVNIDLYEVSSPEVVGDLVKAFGEIFKTQKGPKLTVHVYKTRHLESETIFATILIE
jgi:hypothetical protein